MSQMFCIDIFLIASVTNVKSWFELLQVSCQAACAILCEVLKLRCLSKADNTPKGAHGFCEHLPRSFLDPFFHL